MADSLQRMDPSTRARTIQNNANSLAYPHKPDSRGKARLMWRRKNFYFGNHNTRDSFLVFCEWRRQLIETDEAPAVADVRNALREQGEAVESPVAHGAQGTVAQALACVFATLVLLSTLLGARFFSPNNQNYSTNPTPSVDGLALSEHELEVIRGVRNDAKNLASYETDDGSQFARRFATIMEEGLPDGPFSFRPRDN